MKTLWITGASGQLGQTFRFLSQNNHDFNFIFTDSSRLDLTDSKAVLAFLEKNQIDYCINTMAYTAVDKAESEPEKAYELNAEIPIFLAESCKNFEVKLIHLSTDFVFDGQKNTAYTENDLPNPISIYGKSKRAGEIGILEKNAESMIVRTAWVYSQFGNNFLKTMLRLAETRTELGVVADQVGTPTFAQDLAEGILKLIEIDEKKSIKGIFHYSNEGVASWYDFAQAIFRLAKKQIILKPIRTEAYPTPAKRPIFSLLDKSHWKETTGLPIPHWSESLEKCLKTMKSEDYFMKISS